MAIDAKGLELTSTSMSNATIRQHLHLKEDSSRVFNQLTFRGSRMASPDPVRLGEDMVALANTNGGVLLCGVSQDGQVQGMPLAQLVSVNRLLVEVSTETVTPPMQIQIHHQEYEEKAFVLVVVRRGDIVYECEARS